MGSVIIASVLDALICEISRIRRVQTLSHAIQGIRVQRIPAAPDDVIESRYSPLLWIAIALLPIHNAKDYVRR